MSKTIERVARAVCAHTLSGFCQNVGGELRCKNGRGLTPHWSNCIATPVQLSLSGHEDTARAAIAALREPSEAMWAAGRDVDAREFGGGARAIWQAMIDEALK